MRCQDHRWQLNLPLTTQVHLIFLESLLCTGHSSKMFCLGVTRQWHKLGGTKQKSNIVLVVRIIEKQFSSRDKSLSDWLDIRHEEKWVVEDNGSQSIQAVSPKSVVFTHWFLSTLSPNKHETQACISSAVFSVILIRGKLSCMWLWVAIWSSNAGWEIGAVKGLHHLWKI